MPSAPPAIFAAPAPPTPGAPGAVHAAPSASPAAIGAVHASPGIPSPSAPGAVHVVPVVGGEGGVIVSGITSPTAANGFYPRVDDYDGFPKYEKTDGSFTILHNTLEPAAWRLIEETGVFDTTRFYSNGDEATPNLVASWTAISGTGTVVVVLSSSLAAPGAVHASPGIPSPSAPGAVHVVPVVGGDGSMRIGGGSLFYGATPVVFEDLPLTTPSNGRPRYFYNGVYDANLQWTGTYWLLSKWVPPGELATWYSYDDVATPDLATTWVFAEGYTSGIPTVTALGALAAPGAVHASPGIPSPSSPGAVHVRPSVLHPAAPPVITP